VRSVGRQYDNNYVNGLALLLARSRDADLARAPKISQRQALIERPATNELRPALAGLPASHGLSFAGLSFHAAPM